MFRVAIAHAGTQVYFLAPMCGSSQLSVAPTSEGSNTAGLYRHLYKHTYKLTYTHMLTHTHTHIHTHTHMSLIHI